jgi:hypothetical protein
MTAALKSTPQHGYRLSAFERKDHDFYPTPADLVASLPLGLSRLVSRHRDFDVLCESRL